MITADPLEHLRPPGATWCRVCGDGFAIRAHRAPEGQRCLKHLHRNPCVIEGCKRSTKMPWLLLASGSKIRDFDLDGFLCSEHWRAFVPPRSPQRRIYHRFFKRAKRYGWNDSSSAAFWRIWRRIVATARARAVGDIDEVEIRRLFGWDAKAA